MHQALGDGGPDRGRGSGPALGVGSGAAPAPRPEEAGVIGPPRAGGKGTPGPAPAAPSGKLYSGRFAEGLLPQLERFAGSLEIDVELARYDIAGSLAHARGLLAAGLISPTQLEAIEQGLSVVGSELEAGEFEFVESDEDIHTAIERRLTAIAPDAGARLHTGRSRNDQVALDLRLYCRAACSELAQGIARLVAALTDQARRHRDVAMPGYTHLQRAQPVSVGWHLLAYAQGLMRDSERIRQAYRAADQLPLGAGALAGSTLPLRPDVVARELGFESLMENSMDAVSDRDFALDLIYACATIALHLSRLGEDVVIWASSEFGFLDLADRIATGSSLMPQKKNPDIAELLRGRSGRAIGALTSLATVLKGLPMSYDRDLQEDKLALFTATENALDCLEAAALLVSNLVFDREALARGLEDAGLYATDSAEALVLAGTPFRQAHHQVAAEVREGRFTPPWGARDSLSKRGLDVPALARSTAARVASLRRWART
ncbi:MAG: argininosuccinate lyase, partial [Candidatus Dormibacteraceae bacterium]